MADISDRLFGHAALAYERLPTHLRGDVQSYVEGNNVVLHTEKDVVDAYLIWNGIIGYTGTIIALVRTAYGDQAK